MQCPRWIWRICGTEDEMTSGVVVGVGLLLARR